MSHNSTVGPNGSNGQSARTAVSPRRLAANRANALKSTGPRSAQGKRRSSLNALRHGLTAQTAVLPGESRQELAQTADELRRELRPRGPVQEALAGRVLNLLWKQRRLGRAEEELYARASDQPLERWGSRKGMHQAHPKMWPAPGPMPEYGTAAEALADQFDRPRNDPRDGGGPLTRLEAYAEKLSRSMQQALRELRLLQKEQREREQDDPCGMDDRGDGLEGAVAEGHGGDENEAIPEQGPTQGAERDEPPAGGDAGGGDASRGPENEATAEATEPVAADGGGDLTDGRGRRVWENEPTAGAGARVEGGAEVVGGEEVGTTGFPAGGSAADPRSRKRLQREEGQNPGAVVLPVTET